MKNFNKNMGLKKMIVNCNRCGSEIKINRGERDWLCKKCCTTIASYLDIETLKTILKEMESNGPSKTCE